MPGSAEIWKLVEFFKRHGILTTLGLLILAAVWSIIQPTVDQWRTMPAVHESLLDGQGETSEALAEIRVTIRQINARIDALAGQPPAVIYQDAVRVIPDVADSNRRVRLFYTVWRRKPCPHAQIEDRYLNLADGSYEGELIRTRDMAPAPVSSEFLTHIETLVIPASLHEGEYAYIPVEHCEGLPPVTRPPAYFRIIEQKTGIP